MNRAISTALLSAALALGGLSVASAQALKPVVQRDGGVYTVAACGTSAPVGYALCHSHVVTDASGAFITAATPNTLPGGFGPSDLRSAYNVTVNGSAATTVAIVDAFGYTNAEADLGVYRSTFGLPPCTAANGCFRKVNQNGVQGNYPAQSAGWDDEQGLDLDMVSAMCPNCHIILVQANNDALSNLAAGVNRARIMGANVISNSYGGSEANTTNLEPIYNDPGVAVTASTGDAGFGVQFPASSPHVIAVGGTHLVKSSTTRGWTETVWSGAGSGCSTLYAKPAWQNHTGPDAPDTLCTMRMEADVSAIADPNTGVAIYAPINFGFHSGWIIIGGTSVAAPLVGGIFGTQGGSANYGANIYAAAQADYAAVLNDVTAGSNGGTNGAACGGTYFCVAGVGYDGPTGLGTPNGTTAF